MTHWGWYWKVKQQHKPKALCHQFSHFIIDSFAMFRNKIAVQMCLNTVAYEMPRYNLKATLRETSYLVQYNGGSYTIPIEKQTCTYGGFRYFFHCPRCDKRMRILYCNNGMFLCRKCLKLGYYSQRLRPSQRALIQSIGIQNKLANRGGSLTKKPVRMKMATYQKLKQRYLMYDQQYFDETNKELRTWYGARIEPYIDDFYCAPFSP